MATNRLLLPKTMQDIDGRVERVIGRLGNPEPPLELPQVRELLKLDLAFYTPDDPGIAREVISRLRVATLQVLQRPTLIIGRHQEVLLEGATSQIANAFCSTARCRS